MSKCKYYKKCEKYSEVSVTCNKIGGEYYGSGRYAGCYIKLEEKNGRS